VPGAGEGNRTLVVSLEGFCSTIELHPPCVPLHSIRLDRDLGLRLTNTPLGLALKSSPRVEEVGFEPT
jgi:hypothetical protein